MGGPRIQVLGNRFGMLVGILHIERDMWMFQCDCGNTHAARAGNVNSGSIVSCGCHRHSHDQQTKRAQTHGRAGHGNRDRTWLRWQGMMQRAGRISSILHPKAKYWALAGVTVCIRWQIFENFLADMGECSEGLTLDRYPDPNGNYEPGNCRWATMTEQANNHRERSL